MQSRTAGHVDDHTFPLNAAASGAGLPGRGERLVANRAGEELPALRMRSGTSCPHGRREAAASVAP